MHSRLSDFVEVSHCLIFLLSLLSTSSASRRSSFASDGTTSIVLGIKKVRIVYASAIGEDRNQKCVEVGVGDDWMDGS